MPLIPHSGGHSYTGGASASAGRPNPPIASRQSSVSTNAIPRASRKHKPVAASCTTLSSLATSATGAAQYVVSSNNSASSPGAPTPRASFDEVEVPDGSLRGKLRISLDLEEAPISSVAPGRGDIASQPIVAVPQALPVTTESATEQINAPKVATLGLFTPSSPAPAICTMAAAAEVPTPPAPVEPSTLVNSIAALEAPDSSLSPATSPRLSAHAANFVPPAHALQQSLVPTAADSSAVQQLEQAVQTATVAAMLGDVCSGSNEHCMGTSPAASTCAALTQPQAQPLVAQPSPCVLTTSALTHSDVAVQCEEFVPAPPSTGPCMITQRSPESVSGMSSTLHDKHNSVTIKLNDTLVKDSAGAIYKVLQRLSTVFVNALHQEGTGHESLNRAVKAIAVARKYVKDHHPGEELSFLPFNRSNEAGVQEPHLFAFLAFRTVVSEVLKMHDRTDLNVSSGSDANKMANAIISVVLDRGQAVMKAGGSAAIFVAMTAVVNARRRLKAKHGIDLMLIPAWITEETTWLGRESKFLRFNILRAPLHGPYDACSVHPSQSSYEGPAYA